MNARLGIMQGRLLPPENGRYQSFPWCGWQDEFQLARADGFDCIEFIYEEDCGQHNPLMTDIGLQQIRRLVDGSGVAVRSICADQFMPRPLHAGQAADREAAVAQLAHLIAQAAGLGAACITVPCLDQSTMRTEQQIDWLVAGLSRCLEHAAAAGITICLETDLSPHRFRQLLDRVAHPNLGVTYDIGNSAALGYAPADELDAYGTHIAVLHVKDRTHGGGSVPLGSGAADFEAVLRGLRRCGFDGPMILQAARADSPDQERQAALAQAQHFEECLDRWYR
ncbi:MAG: sugar phosphate isomerase/epimerase family protein [Planctomycetota bacterium]